MRTVEIYTDIYLIVRRELPLRIKSCTIIWLKWEIYVTMRAIFEPQPRVCIATRANFITESLLRAKVLFAHPGTFRGMNNSAKEDDDEMNMEKNCQGKEKDRVISE